MRRQMMNASSGNCRRNASSGGIMCLAMCRPKASSASAGMLIPPLRALCIYIYMVPPPKVYHFYKKTGICSVL